MNKKVSIYNKSSENMSETGTDSVDLIIAGPPYNIGTQYMQNSDSMSFEDYVSMLENIFTECGRILKEDGKMIVESADTIYSQEYYISLSAVIAKILKKQGFSLEKRIVNYIKTIKGYEEPDHGWDKDFKTTKNSHSNCHQIQIFSKNSDFHPEGEVWHLNYPENEEGHPCPYNIEVINRILDMYYEKGNVVLDPFMGTARLGEEVLKRGGTFIGYEKEKEFYETAMERLNKFI